MVLQRVELGQENTSACCCCTKAPIEVDMKSTEGLTELPQVDNTVFQDMSH